jgi:predicted phosphodiesterase
MARGIQAKVYSYSAQTGLLFKEFESATMAEREFMVGEGTIRSAALRGSLSQGYYWSFEILKKHPKVITSKKEVAKPLAKKETTKAQPQFKVDPILLKIQGLYSQQELQAIAKGCKILPSVTKTPIINFNGDHFKFGVLSDTHLGSNYTSPELIYKAFEEFKKEKVDFVVHAGDVCEGMSNRPGHIYELSHLGYEKQKKHAIDVLGQCPVDSFYIDGNHDRWFIKNSGSLIVQDICENIPGATFLGHDEGDLKLKENGLLRLWHGEDGSSYATSYRIQKVVESISGGEKPNIIILGHVHKQAYVFERNIQCVSAGCMQYQTPWMRGKRLAAHVGFHIIDVWIDNKGVSRFKVEWLPVYSQPVKKFTSI